MCNVGTRLLAQSGDPYASQSRLPLKTKALTLGQISLPWCPLNQGWVFLHPQKFPNHLPGICFHQWALAQCQAGSLHLHHDRQTVTEKQGEPEHGCRRDLTPSPRRCHLPQSHRQPVAPFNERPGRGTHQTIHRFSIWNTWSPQVSRGQRTDVSFGGGRVSEHVGYCPVRAGSGVPRPPRESTGSLAKCCQQEGTRYWRAHRLALHFISIPTALPTVMWAHQEASNSQLGQNCDRNAALVINLADVTFSLSPFHLFGWGWGP